VHQFSNPNVETARALIILTPDIGEQYFRDVGAVVNARVDRLVGRSSLKSCPDTGWFQRGRSWDHLSRVVTQFDSLRTGGALARVPKRR
jgi:hypothetical protein